MNNDPHNPDADYGSLRTAIPADLVGLEAALKIATFKSSIMNRDHGEGTSGEGGFFEFVLKLDEAFINKVPDPKGYIILQLAQTAAGLVRAHNLPLFLWTAYLEREVAYRTGLPMECPFQ
jgi:hypothetical protein